jgi:hypothetical protein
MRETVLVDLSFKQVAEGNSTLICFNRVKKKHGSFGRFNRCQTWKKWDPLNKCKGGIFCLTLTQNIAEMRESITSFSMICICISENKFQLLTCAKRNQGKRLMRKFLENT